MGVVCTEDVWGYCTLTNEINAGGYLYLSRYSRGKLVIIEARENMGFLMYGRSLGLLHVDQWDQRGWLFVLVLL